MNKIYTEITNCRICKSKRLTEILNLGNQALTGVFPKPEEKLNYSPVVVCKCNHCHLVQLKHTVKLDLMYGDTYGYQSSLNYSMIQHLKQIYKYIKELNILQAGDTILDIGSNDATLLKFFVSDNSRNYYKLVGIDPTAVKFLDVYNEYRIYCIPDFFNKKAFYSLFPEEKVKVISSIACFYDLEDPIKFSKETADILEDEGVWIIEAAYLPLIIQNLCFDGYVQEHLEYYSLRDIKYIMDQVGLKIIDVNFNNANGGSFRVTVSKQNSSYKEYWRLDSLLLQEKYLELKETHEQFQEDVIVFKERFIDLLKDLKRQNKSVYGIGASTKFNSVLQYCNITSEYISAIGEVNNYKYGRVTPGTNIPIIEEKEVLKINPDYLVIGPYHFKESFIKIFNEYLQKGGHLIFPLPNLEIIAK